MNTNELNPKMCGLAKKLSSIVSDIERVPKNGWNENQRYKYVQESDLVDHIRPLLAAAGVVIWTRIVEIMHFDYTTKSGAPSRTVRVKIEYDFVDSETGETKTITAYGEAADSGDKAIWKAITGSRKYMLLQTFLVSTGDDPERDEHMNGHHAPAPAKATAPSRTAERLQEAREHLAKPAAPPAAVREPEPFQPAESEGENGADPTPPAAPAPQRASTTASSTARSHSEGDIIIPRNVYVNKEWPEKSGTSKKGAPWTKFSFAFRDSATKEMFSAATFSTSQADDMRAHIAAKKPVTIDFEKNGEYWNIAPDGSE